MSMPLRAREPWVSSSRMTWDEVQKWVDSRENLQPSQRSPHERTFIGIKAILQAGASDWKTTVLPLPPTLVQETMHYLCPWTEEDADCLSWLWTCIVRGLDYGHPFVVHSHFQSYLKRFIESTQATLMNLPESVEPTVTLSKTAKVPPGCRWEDSPLRFVSRVYWARIHGQFPTDVLGELSGDGGFFFYHEGVGEAGDGCWLRCKSSYAVLSSSVNGLLFQMRACYVRAFISGSQESDMSFCGCIACEQRARWGRSLK